MTCPAPGLASFDEAEKYMAFHNNELFGLYDQQQCWSGRQALLYLNAVYVRMSLIAGLRVG